jgi:2-polyprenyl-6-hydroxyphenyl methylase/3-demethylubiquinone-9 3-methyltransferase
MNVSAQYLYKDASKSCANEYLWPTLRKLIAERSWPDKRAFDLGCGNGATCDMLSQLGFQMTGVDTSQSGIAAARTAFPHVKTHVGSAYEDLSAEYGTYPLVVSLEVIEHCFDPRSFLRTFLRLIAPNGLGILSTPYHGYLKNLALAVTGRLDQHFTALWDGGHIKFFSVKTLTQLFHELGVDKLQTLRIGRVAPLAKAMVAVVRT